LSAAKAGVETGRNLEASLERDSREDNLSIEICRPIAHRSPVDKPVDNPVDNLWIKKEKRSTVLTYNRSLRWLFI
jgi:hypothetical protein